MTRTLALLIGFTLSLTSSLVAQVHVGQKESGLAAVYTGRLNHHRTASGQIYNGAGMTAAHKSLPYGSRIRVTNPKNHRHVDLRVNDRGPVQNGRILDISPAAASRLHIPRNSMRNVDLEVLSVGNGRSRRQ